MEKNQSKDKVNEVLQNSRILIISSNEKDYIEFRKRFKNVEYFKSIVIAEKYFKDNPEELDKYDAILYRRSRLIYIPADEEDKITLYDKIKEKQNKTLVINLLDIDSLCSEYPFYVAQIQGKIISRYLEKDLIKGIIAELIKNGNIGENSNKIIKPKRNETLETLKDKLGLKILLLGPLQGDTEEEKNKDKIDKIQKIRQITELSVEYQESSITGFSKYIRDKLGQYDIIINDGSFIGNVSSMAEESLEQCKKTNKQLTVLINYYIKYIVDSGSPNTIKSKTTVQVAISGLGVEKPKVKEYSFCTKAKNIYNSLIEIYSVILNIAAKTYEETVKNIKEENKKKEKRQSFIDIINKILNIAYTYLKIKDAKNNPNIEIEKTNNGIIIKNWWENRILSSIIISIIKEKEIKVTVNTRGNATNSNNTLLLSIDNNKEDIYPSETITNCISYTLKRMNEHLIPYIKQRRSQFKKKKRKK